MRTLTALRQGCRLGCASPAPVQQQLPQAAPVPRRAVALPGSVRHQEWRTFAKRKQADDSSSSELDAAAQVEQMTYSQLQQELKSRGLSAGGKRQELAARLAEAMATEMQHSGGELPSTPSSSAAYADGDVDLPPEVAALDYAGLKEALKKRGLSTAGKKAELAVRLADALAADAEEYLDEAEEEYEEYEEYEEGEEEYEEGEEGEEDGYAVAPAAGSSTAELQASVLAELSSMSASELAAELESRGLPSTGATKKDMVQRLAGIMVAEVQSELRASALVSTSSAEQVVSADQLSRRQRALVLTLLAENAKQGPLAGMTRQELYKDAKNRFKVPYGSRDQLLTTLSAACALDELAAMSPSQLSGLLAQLPELEAAHEATSDDELMKDFDAVRQALEGEGGAQVVKADVARQEKLAAFGSLSVEQAMAMKTNQLRDMLKNAGQSIDGNHYVLLQRVRELIESAQKEGGSKAAGKAAAGGASSSGKNLPAASEVDVSSVEYLTLRELRAALVERGLPTAGSRDALKKRLVLALMGQTDAAAGTAAPPLPDDSAGDEAGADLALSGQAGVVLELSSEDLRTLGHEPRADVAVLLAVNPMDALQAASALQAARAVLDNLHTAAPPPLAPVPSASGSEAQEDEEQQQQDAASGEEASGVRVRVFLAIASPQQQQQQQGGADGSGAVSLVEVTAAQLAAVTAEELVAGVLPPVRVLPDPQESTEVQKRWAGVRDLDSLAQALQASSRPAAVFPLVPPGPMYGSVVGALQAAGVAVVGGTSEVETTALATDRAALLQKLEALQYPLVPRTVLSVEVPPPLPGADASAAEHEAAEEAEAKALEAVTQRIAAWCKEQGWRPELKQFTLRPSSSDPSIASALLGSSTLSTTHLAVGAAGVAGCWHDLCHALAEQAGASAEALSSLRVVVEPLMAREAVRFACTVVEGPDGPVALPLSEVELYDVGACLKRYHAQLSEWEMLRMGMPQEEIEEAVTQMRADLPSTAEVVWDPALGASSPGTSALTPHLPGYPRTTLPKIVTPPRLCRKLTHTARHAAAKAFSDLGLSGLAVVEGWVQLEEGWRERLEGDPDAIPTLPDPDPIILEKLAEQAEEVLAQEKEPLHEYFDMGRTFRADLEAFNPATRCSGAHNGEGSVLISDVRVGLTSGQLAPSGLPFIQAAEAGISPAALLRQVTNAALLRAGVTMQAPAEAVAEAAAADAAAAGVDAGASSDSEGEGEGRAVEVLARLPMPPPVDMFESAISLHIKVGHINHELLTRIGLDYASEQMQYWVSRERVAQAGLAMAEELELPAQAVDYESLSYEDAVDMDRQAYEEMERRAEALNQSIANLGELGVELVTRMREIKAKDSGAVEWEDSTIRLFLTPDGEEQPEAAAEQLAAIMRVAEELGFGVEVSDHRPPAEDAFDERPLPDIRADQDASVRQAEARRIALESMCADDNEVMELRTGMVTEEYVVRRYQRRQRAIEMLGSHPLEDEEDDSDVVDVEATEVTSKALPGGGDEGQEEDEEVDEQWLADVLKAREEALALGISDEGLLEEEEQAEEPITDADVDSSEAERQDSQLALAHQQQEEEVEDMQLAGTQAAAGPSLAPQKVWVLLGGMGAARDAALASGQHVLRVLGQYSDVRAEPFLLAPPGEGYDEERRREALLQRRVRWLAEWGLPEDEMPEEAELDNIVHMPLSATGPGNIPVWAIPLSAALRPSVAEVLGATERASALLRVYYHGHDELGKQQLNVMADTRLELSAAGVQGVAGLWGGDEVEHCPTPRPLSLAQFAEEAAQEGAIVVLALQGESGESGLVQALLQRHKVPHTGPPADVSALLWARHELPALLASLGSVGVDAAPRARVTTQTMYDLGVMAARVKQLQVAAVQQAEEMAAQGIDPATYDRPWGEHDYAAELATAHEGAVNAALLVMVEAADKLGVKTSGEGKEGAEGELQVPVLELRPWADAPGIGEATISSPEALLTYAEATCSLAPALPADSLGYSHPEVALPDAVPDAFLFEPHLPHDVPLLLPSAQPNAEPVVEFSPKAGWVEVMFTLVGGLGAMRCLPPATHANLAVPSPSSTSLSSTPSQASKSSSSTSSTQTSSESTTTVPTWLVPTPDTVLSQAALAAACERAMRVVDRLALRGVACVHAYVDAQGGELVVRAVHGQPSFAPGSPVLRSAAASGLYPGDLLREALALALESSQSAGSGLDPDVYGALEGGADGQAGSMLAELDEMRTTGGDEYADEAVDPMTGMSMPGMDDREYGRTGGMMAYGEDDGEDDLLGGAGGMMMGRQGAEEDESSMAGWAM